MGGLRVLRSVSTVPRGRGLVVDQAILDAARAIRPFLAELVGLAAEDIDRELARLLEQAASGVDVENRIVELVSQQAATREWTAAFLQEGQPPSLRASERGFRRLPGTASTISPLVFACPIGDYVWYRPSVGSLVPACPTHSLALVPMQHGKEGGRANR
jgi:hypothetical protein